MSRPLFSSTALEIPGLEGSSRDVCMRRFANAPLHLYGRDQRSGTRAFFKDHVLLNGEYRSTVNEVAGSFNMILAVGRDPLGIGYGGIE